MSERVPESSLTLPPGRTSEKTVIDAPEVGPRPTPSLPVPRSWASQPGGRREAHACCSNCPVCDTLSLRPKRLRQQLPDETQLTVPVSGVSSHVENVLSRHVRRDLNNFKCTQRTRTSVLSFVLSPEKHQRSREGAREACHWIGAGISCRTRRACPRDLGALDGVTLRQLSL